MAPEDKRLYRVLNSFIIVNLHHKNNACCCLDNEICARVTKAIIWKRKWNFWHRLCTQYCQHILTFVFLLMFFIHSIEHIWWIFVWFFSSWWLWTFWIWFVCSNCFTFHSICLTICKWNVSHTYAEILPSARCLDYVIIITKNESPQTIFKRFTSKWMEFSFNSSCRMRQLTQINMWLPPFENVCLQFSLVNRMISSQCFIDLIKPFSILSQKQRTKSKQYAKQHSLCVYFLILLIIVTCFLFVCFDFHHNHCHNAKKNNNGKFEETNVLPTPMFLLCEKKKDVMQ